MTFLVDGTLGGTFPSWTTATRPASPSVGQMGYNTTTGLFDQYTAAGWSSVGAAAGNVIQVTTATSTSAFSTSSGSFVTTGFSASITPKFSTSKVLVMFSVFNMVQNGNQAPAVTIYRGATSLDAVGFAQVYAATPATVTTGAGSGVYLDSPATTSSTAYTLYFRNQNNNGTVTLNQSTGMMSIVLMEVAA